ncbi:alpha/beta fold hydrolase [Streptomyces sp. NPDC088197]|uniref:alpha/beta fold hydrolase n=1 Tax=unclassified Streptomyces TaxID=2593676 RepID=UPI0033A9F0FC
MSFATAAREEPTACLPGPVPAQSDGATARPFARISEWHLEYEGFRYTCRIRHHERPVDAPLLILGGSSQDRHSWMRHEQRIGTAADVITVDLPGYGTADFLPAFYGIDFLAAVVRHLLDELVVPAVNLVAACFGGAVGLRFAQHYPARVERLFFVGMTTRIPPDYAAAMERWDGMIDRGETDRIARELTDRFMSPPGTGRVRKHAAVARLVYGGLIGQDAEQLRKSAEHNKRLMRHEWYRPEPVPAVPSLVVTGEYDTLCTPEMGREVAAVLRAATFLTIDETDHLAPVERIADFADLVTRFCAGHPLDDLPYCSAPESAAAGTLREPAVAWRGRP